MGILLPHFKMEIAQYETLYLGFGLNHRIRTCVKPIHPIERDTIYSPRRKYAVTQPAHDII